MWKAKQMHCSTLLETVLLPLTICYLPREYMTWFKLWMCLHLFLSMCQFYNMLMFMHSTSSRTNDVVVFLLAE
jgi:hypothetical protein